MRQRAHPFRAEPGLAGAAPAEHQPGGPRTAVVGVRRRLLMRMRERGEVTIQPHPVAQVRTSPSQHRPASVRLATNASMRRARSRRNSSMSRGMSSSSFALVFGESPQRRRCKRMKCLRQHRERARGALRLPARARAAQLRPHRFFGGQSSPPAVRCDRWWCTPLLLDARAVRSGEGSGAAGPPLPRAGIGPRAASSAVSS